MATPELRELRDRRRTIVLPTPPMENGDDAENRTAIMIVGNPNVMTRGREFPAYSSVRRQLFVEGSAAEVPEKVKKELVNKITKNEYVIQNLNDEIIAKGMKWNFNFLTETPIDGRIKWYRKSNADEWVGMKPSGRTIYMRNKKKGAAYKSVYADERSKKNERRLPPHTVERRRSFFTMAKAFDYAMAESADDNFMNTLQDVTPPIYSEGIHWNFDCINTVPLPGPVHWHQAGDCWVGHRPGLPNTIFIHRPHSLPQLRAHSPPVTKRCTRHSAARQRTGASAVPRTKASAVKRTAPAKINHASIISSSDNGQASNKKGKKPSKKEKAEDFEGIEDKTENEVKVSSEVSKASNNIVDENRKSKNMKTVAIAEIANDGNHNDDELLTKTSFEKLKISDNNKTEKKQDSIEKITVMKNKNEAPPKSNGPMYPDMLNAPRKKPSKKEKAEDFEGIEDKTENEVKVSSEVSKASNNIVDENRKSKNMKTVAIAEIANDGNHNDDELLTKTSFEKLKISDNNKTEKKQDSIEKITVMKNKNEAPPKSNGPMYPDMLNAPRKALKRRLFYR